jgi:hypothetical protein
MVKLFSCLYVEGSLSSLKTLPRYWIALYTSIRRKHAMYYVQGFLSLSHCGLAIYIKYLKAKEELWELKYFTMQRYNNLQKIL